MINSNFANHHGNFENWLRRIKISIDFDNDNILVLCVFISSNWNALKLIAVQVGRYIFGV